MAEPDLYSLLMDPEEDARMKAQAMAQALSRQRGMGNLAMLTGDRVLAPFGQSQIQQANAREQGIAGAGEQRAGARLRQLLQTQAEQFQGREGARDRGLRRELAGADLLAQMERARMAQEAAGKKQTMDTEEGLRKELMGNPVTKQAQEVATAYERIKRAAATPSAAGDIALIFGFMKMMDPSSTVREGEFATAQNAGSVPQTIIAAYNKALSGERLAPELRTDFVTQAGGLYQAQMGQQRKLSDSYRQLATGAGVDPGRVAIPLGFEEPTAPAAPAQPAGGGAVRRTDQATGETRVWNGSAWVKE